MLIYFPADFIQMTFNSFLQIVVMEHPRVPINIFFICSDQVVRGREALTHGSTTLDLLFSPKVHYSDIQLLKGKRTER